MSDDVQRHPIQPLVFDNRGVIRFKENSIVRALLDYSSVYGFGINEIAYQQPSTEDYTQLMQLIGYSVHGHCEVSSVSEIDKDIAWALSQPPDKMEAIIKDDTLNNAIQTAKLNTLEPLTKIYGVDAETLKRILDSGVENLKGRLYETTAQQII